MPQTYRAPTATALGTAQLATLGLTHGALTEKASAVCPVCTWTTHAMLEL
jgi:hypothetical protein